MNNKELKANAIVGVAPLGDLHFEENTLESPKAYTNSKSKIKTLTSDNKGITLIALVITIIVMLILVAVTVTVAINGGLFTTAKQATTDTQYHADREMLLSAVIGAIGSNAEVDFTELDKNLPNGFTGNNGTYTSEAGNNFKVDKNGNITDGEPPAGGDYKPVSELFVAEKETLSEVKKRDDSTTDDNLHIGDFINYTAGDWKQEEITAIRTGKNGSLNTANGNNTTLPTQDYQFGGFAAGDSRDGNAKPYEESYNGIKDLEGETITGWRLFDVKEDGSIVLISTGCPEDFYVCETYSGNENRGYINEYILSGRKRDVADYSNCKNRDWSNYVNATQHAESANSITKEDLDDWFEKYMGVPEGQDLYYGDGLDSVYKTRYENLIDNYSYYWLATTLDSVAKRGWLYYVSPFEWWVKANYGETYGVRVLVYLDSGVQLSPSGTVTVNKLGDYSKYGGPYTYNMWNIQ